MRTTHRWNLCFSLGLLLWTGNAISAQAQTATDPQARAIDEARARAPWVAASVSSGRLRFAAPVEVFQLRLEVFSAAGERLYDSDFRLGNLLDWTGQDQQGRRLLDGSYRCLITVRDLAGRTSQREGQLLVQADAFSLPPADAAAQAIQSANADRSLLTAVGEAVGSATTLLSHDGTDGRLTAGRGALSLRTGNFFAGTDTERMRITAAGDVGIGVEQPAAKLDVNGLIRTSEGIVFPDGTIQKTAANPSTSAARDRLTAMDNPTGRAVRDRLSPGRTVQGGSEQKEKAARGIFGPNQVNISGSGTTNRITKWTDGPNGVVGDSTISEVAGDIGIGTASPGGVFDLQRSSSGDILQRLWNTGTGGAKLRYVAATGQTSQLQLTDGLEWLMAIAGNNTIGMQFRVRDTGDANNEATLATKARMTILRNGNVGIGTTTPLARLDVRGDVFVGLAAAPDTAAGDNLYIANNGGDSRNSFRLDGFINNLYLVARSGAGSTTGTGIGFLTAPPGGGEIDRVTIDPNGNVGIGITAPGRRLHVVDPGGRNGTIQVGSLDPMGAGERRIIKFGDSSNNDFVYLGEEDQDDRLVFRAQAFYFKVGDVLPDSNASQNLGSDGHRWNMVFASNGMINTSDARLKQQVSNLSYGLREVLQLRPVSFEWKDRPDGRRHLGLLAQEAERIIPEVVVRATDPATPLGLSYTDLIPVVIKAIQEQQTALEQKEAAIKSLRTENAALQQRNAELDARLTALEQAMQQLLGQQQGQAQPGKRQ